MRIETYRDGKLVHVDEVPDPDPAPDQRSTLADAIASATTLDDLKAALLGTDTGVPVAAADPGDTAKGDDA